MKITRRQLSQLIKEAMRNPDEIDSQDMADAKRYAGDSVESMAAYLRISVEDWHRIRSELDDHYEDRFMDDQEAFDYEAEFHYPKILGYTHPETGKAVMINVQSRDDMDDILDPLLRKYPDLAYSID